MTVNDKRIVTLSSHRVCGEVVNTLHIVVVVAVDVIVIFKSEGYLTCRAYVGRSSADVLVSKNVSTKITLGMSTAVATGRRSYTGSSEHIVRNGLACSFVTVDSLTGCGSGTGCRSEIVTDGLVTAIEVTAFSLTYCDLITSSACEIVTKSCDLIAYGNEFTNGTGIGSISVLGTGSSGKLGNIGVSGRRNNLLTGGNSVTNCAALTCGVTVLGTGRKKLVKIYVNVTKRVLEIISAGTALRTGVNGVTVVDTVGLNSLGNRPIVNVTVEAPSACYGVAEYYVVEHNTTTAGSRVTADVEAVNRVGKSGKRSGFRVHILTVDVVVHSDGIAICVKLDTDNNVHPTGELILLGNGNSLKSATVPSTDGNDEVAISVSSGRSESEEVIVNAPIVSPSVGRCATVNYLHREVGIKECVNLEGDNACCAIVSGEVGLSLILLRNPELSLAGSRGGISLESREILIAVFILSNYGIVALITNNVSCT